MILEDEEEMCMLSEVLTQEVIWSGLLSGIKPFLPYIYAIVASYIALAIVKSIIQRVVFEIGIICGDSRREAKHKAKITGNFLDLASAVNDVFKC